MTALFPYIERLGTPEYLTCDWKKDGQCFEWATHFVEGGFYCDEHKEAVLRILKEDSHD
jgi:hypothetical protein